MRYVLEPDTSQVLVRMHAFLHKATATTGAIRGWFTVASPDHLLGGPTEGLAEVNMSDFAFSSALIAASARRWIGERGDTTLRFDLDEARGTERAADIRGTLTIGERARPIQTEARVSRRGDDVVVEGTWKLSQAEFGLTAPLGVKDRLDVLFRLLGRPETG